MRRLQYLLPRIGIALAAIALALTLNGNLRDAAFQPIRQARAPSHIQNYVKNTKIRKLQLGAGPNLMSGWLNTDIEAGANCVYLDASKRFPIADAAFHYIFTEHMIEHLSYEDGAKMLKECHRVLAPSGKVRIVTPNLLQFTRLIGGVKTDEMRQFIKGKLAWHGWPTTPEPETYILNMQLRAWGHQFLYTPETLRAGLESAGFSDVKYFQPGQSDEPQLSDIDQREKAAHIRDLNAYEVMTVQATRR